MISSYAELQAAICRWSRRADMASMAPEFIELGEKDISAALRARLQDEASTVTTTAGVGSVAMPSNLLGIESLTINGVSHGIDYVTPDKLASDYDSSYTGVPIVYTTIGDDIHFGPTPDSAYTVSIVYSKTVTPLSVSAPTNNLLTKWPNVYLAASMIWCSQYRNDQAAKTTWEADFLKRVAAVNLVEWHAGGSMCVSSDVRF